MWTWWPLLLLLVPPFGRGFVPAIMGHERRTGGWIHPPVTIDKHDLNIPILRAIIYGPDGQRVTEEENDSDSNPSYGTTTTETTTTTTTTFSIVESLMSQVSTGLLVRVACAMAPPPHDNLQPQHVTRVSLVAVDATHLQLAVAVPSSNDANGSLIGGGGETCVQILVSVPLPTPCVDCRTDRNAWKACLLDNLQQLDALAEPHLLRQQQQQQDQASRHGVERNQLLKSLESPAKNMPWPDWWVFCSPPQVSLTQECDNLQSLLNEEDFVADLQLLAQHAQRKETSSAATRNDANSKIVAARVAWIGPVGFLLRALTKKETILDLFTPFDNPVDTVEDLRSTMLDWMDRAAELATHKAETVPVPASVEPAVEELVAPPSLLVDGETDTTSTIDAEQQTTEEERDPIAESAMEEKEEVITAVDDPSESDGVNEAEDERISSTADETIDSKKDEEPTSRSLESIIQEARRQPKSPEEEARLAQKYAAISDLGERAYAILKDLYMI